MPEQQPVPPPPPPADGLDPAAAERGLQSLRFLDAATVHFRHDGCVLKVRREAEEWREAGLARLFPLSDADEWIAVLDDKGKELGVLRELAALADDDRACVQRELERRYLVPQIRRVLACRERFDLAEWTVETDRGPAVFVTRHGHKREQAKEPLPGRFCLTDVEGNRYDVPNLAALDPQSRRLLEPHL